MNKTRLEAFSDGVFAIVITLLILDIRLPIVSYDQLPAALNDAIPHIIAYVMSFIVIWLYWIFHHNTSQLVHKVDRPFIWMNMILLLFVSFLPFPTSLMGKYPFKQIPVLIYGLNLLATNLTGFIMTLYVYRKELGTTNYTNIVFRKQMKMYAMVNGLYIVAIALAFFYPMVSYMIFAIVLGLLILTTKSNRHTT